MLGWQRAAIRGALVGAGGAAVFLALHAVLVEPIWRAAPRAALLGPAAGAVLGFALHRAAREPRFRGPLGGPLLGALAGLTLAPFAIAGWMRSRGAPDAFWLLVLALLVASLHHVLQAVQDAPGRMRRLELGGLLVAANAIPIYFLTFISDFHEGFPNPVPMTVALAAIYVAGGAAYAAPWGRRLRDA